MSFQLRLPSKIVLTAIASSLALTGASALAQGPAEPDEFAVLASRPLMPAALYAGSVVTAPPTLPGSAATGVGGGALPTASSPFRPFSAIALTVKAGSTGIGVDLATPLATHLGLRTGASYFSYNPSFSTDGLNINSALHLQNASTSLDIYPFHNSFRISPGLTWNNATRMSAKLFSPGGSVFSFGEGANTYSDPSDPVNGSASVVMGHGIAPRITIGWGSILPNHGGRISFPVELGFQHTQKPTLMLAIAGSGCGSESVSGTVYSGCGPVDQKDVQQEQSDLNSDIAPLRFYPIVSFGVTLRVGHSPRGQ